MNISQGSLVDYKGRLYYVDSLVPLILSNDTKKFLVDLKDIKLYLPGDNDKQTLMNYAFIYSNTIMNLNESLDYVRDNMSMIPQNIIDIYNRRRMSTFSIGEIVYVGTHQFSVEAFDGNTYRLSPNVSGGGGGVSVNAPKGYVTKEPNDTPEGARRLHLLYDRRDLPQQTIKDLSEAKCVINDTEMDQFNSLTTMVNTDFPIPLVVSITYDMFGYKPDIVERYHQTFDDTEKGRFGILNTPNRPYNEKMFNMRMGKRVDDADPDVLNARRMETVFDKVYQSGIFRLTRHAVVYRSFADNVLSAKDVCGMNLNRCTSTTLVKNYADRWGQAKKPVTMIRNEKGFFTTIIIPAGTRSVIPLLLFDDLNTKQKQYEVLLSPDGILKDTGFVDSGGSKIVVYLEPEQCGMPMSEILRMEVDGTNILGFIASVFNDDITYQGATGGRKTRKRLRKHKSKRV